MYLCEMTGTKEQIHKYMVPQCSKFCLRQDSNNSISFVQDPKFRVPRTFCKNSVFHWRKIS